MTGTTRNTATPHGTSRDGVAAVGAAQGRPRVERKDK